MSTPLKRFQKLIGWNGHDSIDIMRSHINKVYHPRFCKTKNHPEAVNQIKRECSSVNSLQLVRMKTWIARILRKQFCFLYKIFFYMARQLY